jgi:hypothetical protein
MGCTFTESAVILLDAQDDQNLRPKAEKGKAGQGFRR